MPAIPPAGGQIRRAIAMFRGCRHLGNRSHTVPGDRAGGYVAPLMGRRLALAALAALACVAPAPALAKVSPEQCASLYRPAEQPPFGGAELPSATPVRLDQAPSGQRLSARRAIAAAEMAEAIQAERAETPAMRPHPYLRASCFWEIRYFVAEDGDTTQVAQALVSLHDGEVLEAWRDHQVEVKLARGYEGAVAGLAAAWWIWVPLCLLFVAPFFDFRRPFRLLHLDLLAIVALSASLAFFNRGEITTSVPLIYPPIAWLFARMMIIGLGGARVRGQLVPHAPIVWLAVGAIALVGGRIALNLADSTVIDIGLAGVVGADRIEAGEGLYDGDFTPEGVDLRGDVYGPFNYLSYVPFEQAFPWSGEWDELPAAHAAAIAFDLLAALALLAVGWRLRGGRDGPALGIALAYAWLACPWTLYAMNAAANDALVGALVAAALAALSWPALCGVLLALGAAAKFGPLALAPLFATGTGERRGRSMTLFTAAFVLIALAVTLPFLPDGGFRELYDRTLGYQAARGSPFSIWGLAPSLEPLQDVTRVLAVVLGLAVALIPRRKTPVQIAALGAAVLIAIQVGAEHWFYFSLLWFLPLVFAAVFLPFATVSGRRADLVAASSD